MNANRIIYLINQSRELSRAWRELSDWQKRAVVKEGERTEERDLERGKKLGPETITSDVQGVFRDDASCKAKFFQIIK